MCAFVNSAQSWDVGIFKWVDNVSRLYPCALYKSLNAPYRLFQSCQLISPHKTIFAILKKYIFFLHTVHFFFFARYQTSVPCKKKSICTSTNFLSRGITPLVSAEVRFGCRDRAGSRNSNLIPFQAGLILSLLVCVMQAPIGTSTLP